MDRELSILNKEKHRRWNQWEKKITAVNWLAYSRVRNILHKTVKTAKRNFEKKIACDIKTTQRASGIWPGVKPKSEQGYQMEMGQG